MSVKMWRKGADGIPTADGSWMNPAVVAWHALSGERLPDGLRMIDLPMARYTRHAFVG